MKVIRGWFHILRISERTAEHNYKILDFLCLKLEWTERRGFVNVTVQRHRDEVNIRVGFVSRNENPRDFLLLPRDSQPESVRVTCFAIERERVKNSGERGRERVKKKLANSMHYSRSLQKINYPESQPQPWQFTYFHPLLQSPHKKKTKPRNPHNLQISFSLFSSLFLDIRVNAAVKLFAAWIS